VVSGNDPKKQFYIFFDDHECYIAKKGKDFFGKNCCWWIEPLSVDFFLPKKTLLDTFSISDT